MNHRQAMDHAQRWIENWNAGDLGAILEGYALAARFRSPVAKAVTGDALVVGLNALREYWSDAIERSPGRCFVLDQAAWDPIARALVVFYTSTVDARSRRACELMVFNERGEQTYGEALYGGHD